jgi:hypothetical protein
MPYIYIILHLSNLQSGFVCPVMHISSPSVTYFLVLRCAKFIDIYFTRRNLFYLCDTAPQFQCDFTLVCPMSHLELFLLQHKMKI